MGACSLCSDRRSGLPPHKFIIEHSDFTNDDPPALRYTRGRASSNDNGSVILGQPSQGSNVVSPSLTAGDLPKNRLTRDKIKPVENVPCFEKNVSFLIDDVFISDTPNFVRSDSEVSSLPHEQTETKTRNPLECKASNSKSTETKEHSENEFAVSSLLQDETETKKRSSSLQDKASNSTSTETKKSNLLFDIEEKSCGLCNDTDEAKVDDVSQFSYARDEVSPMTKLPSVRRGTYVYRVKTDEELIYEMLYGDDSSDSPI